MRVFGLSFLLCVLVACNGTPHQQAPPSSNEPGALPVIAEQEFTDARAQLATTETNLKPVGLTFAHAPSYAGNDFRTWYKWSRETALDVSGKTFQPSAVTVQLYLQNYSSVAHTYLNRYAGPFVLLRSDGTKQVIQMMAFARSDLLAKAYCADLSLWKLRILQAKPPATTSSSTPAKPDDLSWLQ